MRSTPGLLRSAALAIALALLPPAVGAQPIKHRHPAARRVQLERGPQVGARVPVQLGETKPIETNVGHPGVPAARDLWLEMIRGARRSLDLEQFYLSAWPGEPLDEVLDEIGRAAARGVRVRLLLDHGMHETYPQPADSLARLPGIEVRTISMSAITGSGVQHSKYFLVDGEEAWVGSQNLDWRALKHIHELGVRLRDPGVAADLGRVFEMDWAASDAVGSAAEDSVEVVRRSIAVTGARPDPAPDAVAPRTLPVRLVQAAGDTAEVWTSYSPKGFIPDSSRWDRDAIVRLLDGAREEIVVQLLSYGLGKNEHRDSTLHEALRRASRRGVRVRLLISDWMAGRPAMADLESLAAAPGVEVKLSVIGEWSGGYIPYARVDHCKYVTVDGLWTWIGTSNWEPSYFVGSRNVAVTIRNRRIAADARRIFATSWEQPANVPVRRGGIYTPRVHGETPPPGKTAYGR